MMSGIHRGCSRGGLLIAGPGDCPAIHDDKPPRHASTGVPACCELCIAPNLNRHRRSPIVMLRLAVLPT
jgi:hypothetical protein